MATRPQALPEAEEVQEATELQNLQVRIVQMTELGANAAPTALEEAPGAPPAPARAAPQPKADSASPPQARPASPPQARPAPPPQARPALQPKAGSIPQPQARSTPRLPPPARGRELAAPSRTPSPSPEPLLPAARRTATTLVVAARPEPEAPPRRRLITSGRLSFVLVAVVLYYGWTMQIDRYINPNRGVGYALGIIGGSLMLVLLAYSLRKRWNWLAFIGSTPSWFRFHMVLGIVGPLCILYHSNFSTGATNSNVALFSMLAVAVSGIVGRYFYSHIHNELDGRKLELSELQASAEGLRSLSSRISFVPDLVTRLEGAEQRVLQAGPHLSLLGFAKPLVVGIVARRARSQLYRYIRRSLKAKSRKSAVVRAEHKRLRYSARAYVERRMAATRRVAAFQGYERLFSLWHSLHIPLIFVMVIAAIIHVIAVHVY